MFLVFQVITVLKLLLVNLRNFLKNLEVSYIALWKSTLNEQKDFERLVLFRNDVT